jgi:predicted nucleic acid-binding protein
MVGSLPLGKSQALNIVCRSDIAIYDACYVALAHALKGTLATFDVDLMKRTKKHFPIPVYAFPSE